MQQIGSGFQILSAWYGTESSHGDAGDAAAVAWKVRESVHQYGYIRIPQDMMAFFGRGDPAPGVEKMTVIHLQHNGEEHHLMAPEGRDFEWKG